MAPITAPNDVVEVHCQQIDFVVELLPGDLAVCGMATSRWWSASF